MTIKTVNKYPVIANKANILKKGKQASHCDGQARQLYLEAFISAFAHAHNTGNHTVVCDIFALVPKHSGYKSKIKVWIVNFTPLEWDNTVSNFIIGKETDGSKQKWREKAIRAAHSNPFFTAQPKSDVIFDSDKQLKGLESKLKKMVKDFEENDGDADTIVSLKLMLSSFS